MEKTGKILIVDDDASVRSSISAYLDDQDYVVSAVADGNNILEDLRREKPNCILIDLRMPGKSGVEVIQLVRGVDAELPIIVISGQNQLDSVIEAIRVGAWDFITKPIEDLALVANRIENALERRELGMLKKEYQTELENKIMERTRELMRRTAQLEISLDEKTVLLNEVHHRVKNNLQIISSFISLENVDQMSATNKKVLIELKTRIQAMALIHEIIYQEDKLNRVQLHDICVNISMSLRQIFDCSNVAVDVQTDDLHRNLDLNDAVSLGILINEILSNGYQKCFPEKTGNIQIAFSQPEGFEYALIYSDDGIRQEDFFSEQVDVESDDGLEKMIVQAIVEQLGGTMSFPRLKTGNRVEILFKPSEGKYLYLSGDSG